MAAGRDERTAVVLSVGEELLAGDIRDTNREEVAAALRELGFDVRGLRTVGDGAEEIAEAVTAAAARASVVILTGGLGPTEDDRTRHGLARAASDELVFDEEELGRIADLFARVGRAMSESNRVQAYRPSRARWIENRHGTAAGLRAEVAGALVVALPGPPFEMRPMLAEVLLEDVVGRFGPGAAPPRVKVRAHGLSESIVGERVREFMGEGADPRVGITVSGGILTVTATSHAADRASAERAVEAVGRTVAERLGPNVYGRGDVTLEEATVASLRRAGMTCATAESCTGGLVASLLTRVPGSSDVFLEGCVTYSNAAKSARLGVPAETIERHGAVSEEVARAMAEGIVRTSGASVGVSLTGVAGPGGGTAEKPVGLVWLGLRVDGVTHARRIVLPGDRETVQLRAARAALDLVRRGASGTLGVR